MRTRQPALRLLLAVPIVTVAGCAANGDSGPILTAAGETGRQITRTNGCSACHGRSGEGGPGPAFVGLYGSVVELDDGTTVTADDEYLYRAITDPSAERVAGYGFPMPSNDLSDAEVESVLVYLRELAAPGEGS
jgi:cytochrome c oxidase subunit 2